MEVKQNTLYLTSQNTYVSRDNLNLRIEVDRELKLSVPIHHLESVCIFGQSVFTPGALELCWENAVSVNYFSENGYFMGRWEGVANTSVLLRRAQYRIADDPCGSASIARQCVAGKLQNSRVSLLRSARESDSKEEDEQLKSCAEEIGRILHLLEGANPRLDGSQSPVIDRIRGYEGQSANVYFSAFSLHLRHQRQEFNFTTRTRRPPRDRMNCLLSFLYALVRHDCIAALSATGLDPFVGYLHADRPNRPALALDVADHDETYFSEHAPDRCCLTLPPANLRIFPRR
jgi:CRISPR-associated protein Cas1